LEPLYSPQVNILEDCLRREAERVAHQENLMNRVVYDCVDTAAPEGEPAEDCDNDQTFAPYYQATFVNDHTLEFESRFESGNLRRAIQVYEFEYDLILKPNYNTRGFTQWFYFRVARVLAGRTYRFNIVNLLKPDSLYNHGMRPLMYSEAQARLLGQGWRHAGKDVCYYQNSMKKKTQGHYFTLTFSVTFPHDHD
jgi:hypothetical protein